MVSLLESGSVGSFSDQVKDVTESISETTKKLSELKNDLHKKNKKISSKERKVCFINKAEESSFGYFLIRIAKIFAGVFGIALYVPFATIAFFFLIWGAQHEDFVAVGRPFEKLGALVSKNAAIVANFISSKETISKKKENYEKELEENKIDFEELKNFINECNKEFKNQGEKIEGVRIDINDDTVSLEMKKMECEFEESYNLMYAIRNYEKELNRCVEILEDRKNKSAKQNEQK